MRETHTHTGVVESVKFFIDYSLYITCMYIYAYLDLQLSVYTVSYYCDYCLLCIESVVISDCVVVMCAGAECRDVVITILSDEAQGVDAMGCVWRSQDCAGTLRRGAQCQKSPLQ